MFIGHANIPGARLKGERPGARDPLHHRVGNRDRHVLFEVEGLRGGTVRGGPPARLRLCHRSPQPDFRFLPELVFRGAFKFEGRVFDSFGWLLALIVNETSRSRFPNSDSRVISRFIELLSASVFKVTVVSFFDWLYLVLDVTVCLRVWFRRAVAVRILGRT